MTVEQLQRKLNSNEIVINTKSSYKSHLVRCQALLDNINYDKVIIKAMGRATNRAANLAIQLNANNFNTFDLKPETYSVELIEDKSRKPLKGADKDGFDPDAIDVSTKKLRYVPAIEISVCKSQLEIEKIRQVKNKDIFKKGR
uniref:Ribonuclease P protein subunit p20 n=1 Tax=Aceria tosichella TaxID=561515 RepID=A0A6G1SBT5_9ACAR